MDSGIIYTPSSEGSPNVRESPCLDPVMSFSTMLRNEEVLLTTMDIYLKQRMSTIPPDMEADSVINIGTTPVSKKFWSNIENGIYLWKISATFPDKRDRARSALEEAQTIAASALATEPFDFVRKVLLVLSPSNTSVNPPLRRVLLGCIALTSRETLGGFHPITRVCESILIEEGTAVDSISDSIAHELCRNALYHMQELFSHHLGASHAATCKLVKSHIAMERRCGDLERAKQLATSAHRSSIATRGPHSIQAREVAMELAYVLARMGEHDIALALHLEIIQRARNPDRVCVYAMESIAEYHMSSSNTTDAAEWLLKAQTMAMELGLEKIELLHITDKLENVLRRN